MRHGAIIRTTRADGQRFNKALARTIERYEMKMAFMQEWDAAGTDPKYLQRLRKEATKLRAQLKVKGVIFEGRDRE